MEATGFDSIERTAKVEVGTTTTVDLQLQAGAISEKITVNDVAPLIRYHEYQVGGLISRNQIENLPLKRAKLLRAGEARTGRPASGARQR